MSVVRRSRRLWVSNAAVCIGAIAVLISATIGLAGTRCANQIVETVLSPDGRLEAIVFVRACSEPTRLSTQVSILKRNRTLSNVAGNVFMCTGSYGLSHVGSGEPRVTATWEAENQLVIRYPSEANILVGKAARKQIRVRYEPENVPSEVGSDD